MSPDPTRRYADPQGHGSHAPILAAVMAVTTGPVLELGAGTFSTALLHEIAKAQGRALFTVESDEHWWNEVRWLDRRVAGEPEHIVMLEKNVLAWPGLIEAHDMPWSLVFLDHAEPHGATPDWRWRTLAALAVLAPNAFVVVHDAHPGGVAHYKLAEPMKKFRYRFDYLDFFPGTVVLSNHKPWVSEREHQ